jgi:hypothetical protein
VIPLVGSIAEIAPSGVFTFTGPTAPLSLNAQTRVIGSGSAVLGVSSGEGAVDMTWCSQQAGGGILEFSTYLTFDITTQRIPYAVSASTTLNPGSYTVGLCARSGAATVDRNDWVSAWVLLA